MTTINLTGSLEPDVRVECCSCTWHGMATALENIEGFEQRVAPGEPVPAGQCPKCHSLAHRSDGTTPRGRAYRRLRRLVLTKTADEVSSDPKLHTYASEQTTRGMAILALFHDGQEEGLPITCQDACQAFLFAAVICACEAPIMDGMLGFNTINEAQKLAMIELLGVADDMVIETLKSIALDVPAGLEGAAMSRNMTEH